MLKAAVLLFALLVSGALRAAEPVLLDGINVEPVITYYRAKISRLKKDSAVYNWSSNALLKNMSDILKIKRDSAQTYWNFFDVPGSAQGNYFGQGLYAAVDPVATSGYGGPGNNWLLTRMVFPKGFRILNVGDIRLEEDQPMDVAEVLMKFNCSTHMGVNFAGAGKRFPQLRCSKFLRQLFAHYLKIDAFAYNYFAQSFAVCTKPGPSTLNRFSVAFVILDGDWMSADRVQAFTANMVGFSEDRRLLQTLFIRADNQSKRHASIIGKLLPRAQSLDKASFCGDNQCNVYVYRDGWSQEARYARPVDEDLIRPENASRILWSDLVGKRQAEHTDEWIQQNIIGCDGTLPF